MDQLIRTLERHRVALLFLKKLRPSLAHIVPEEEGGRDAENGLFLAEPQPTAYTEMIDTEILYSISLHPIWLNSPIFGELIITKLYLDLGVDKELIERRFHQVVRVLTQSSLEVFDHSDDLDARFIHYITLKTLTGNTAILASLKASLGEKFMGKMMAVAEGMVKPDSESDYFCFFDRLEDLMVTSIETISAELAADASYLRKVEFYHYFLENGYLQASTTINLRLAFTVLVAIGLKKQADLSRLRVFLLQHYQGVAKEADIQVVLQDLVNCQLLFKANNVKTPRRQQYSLTSDGVAITRHEVSRKIVAGQQKPLEQLASYNPTYQHAATELLDPANQHILMKKLGRMAESFVFCRS